MYIRVRIFPNAKHEKVILKKPDTFDIHVKQKAERNMANNRCKEILATQFGVPISGVRIINGHHERTKLFSINGIDRNNSGLEKNT